MPPKGTKRKLLTSENEKQILRGMIMSGQVSFEDTAASVFREHEWFQGHGLTKFRAHWNELKDELQGSGKF